MREEISLVGRERELEATGAFFDRVADGDGGVLVVEGPAGIGKSAVLRAAEGLAAERGFRALRSRGTELEIDFPFGVARQLLEGQLVDPACAEAALSGAAAPAREVLGVAGGPDGEGGEAVSFSALHGLYWTVLNVSRAEPLLLVVDDLHWCDSASLRFLAYLSHRLEGSSVALACGLRSTDPGADGGLIGEIATAPGSERISPGLLDDEDIGELIEDALGKIESADALREACAEATGGNPLLLDQLLGALREEGSADPSTVARIGRQAVARTVAIRLGRLSGDAVAVARSAAVLGDGTDVLTLAAHAELPQSRTAELTAELERVELLRPGGSIEFVHPLVRDAVVAGISAGERQLAHARAAAILKKADGADERVAAHLLAAPPSSEEWVTATLERAAGTARSRGAPEGSAVYLARLLEACSAENRPSVLFDLGMSEVESNGVKAAEHLLGAYGGLGDDERRGIAAYALARTWMFTGQPQRAVDFAAGARSEIASTAPDVARMIEAVELIAQYFGATVPEHRERCEQLREPPPTGAGPGGSMLAAAAAFDWMMRGGRADDCAALARRALESEEMIGLDNGLLWVLATLVLVEAEQPEAGGRWDAALAKAHRHGSSFGTLSVQLWRGYTQFLAGDLVESERSWRAGIEQAQLWGIHGMSYADGFIARILMELGRTDEAEVMLRRGSPPVTNDDGAQFWRENEAELLLAAGKADEALAAARRYEEIGDWRVGAPRNAGPRLAARALAQLGRQDEAIAVAEEDLERSKGWGPSGAVGRSLRILGTIEGEEGIPRLEEAVSALESSPMRLEHAKALTALGSAIRRCRKPTQARDPLRRAFELAEACGAERLAGQIRTELHASGARPRSSALSGPDSLTASERRVADLAAGGQSNKEIAQALFVTPKTVEVHLSAAYRKLGIGSRRELPAALGS